MLGVMSWAEIESFVEGGKQPSGGLGGDVSPH